MFPFQAIFMHCSRCIRLPFVITIPLRSSTFCIYPSRSFPSLSLFSGIYLSFRLFVYLICFTTSSCARSLQHQLIRRRSSKSQSACNICAKCNFSHFIEPNAKWHESIGLLLHFVVLCQKGKRIIISNMFFGNSRYSIFGLFSITFEKIFFCFFFAS